MCMKYELIIINSLAYLIFSEISSLLNTTEQNQTKVIVHKQRGTAQPQLGWERSTACTRLGSLPFEGVIFNFRILLC